MQYIHQNRIAHSDIKLQNILLLSDGTTKLSDFGLSQEFSEEQIKENMHLKEKLRGTAEYYSPEMIETTIKKQQSNSSSSNIRLNLVSNYDPFKADMWALGVCLY